MMKIFLALFLTAVAMTASAKEIPLYVGTYTENTGSEGIYRGLLNSDTGELGLFSPVAETNNPSFLAISPDEKYLYAAIEADGGNVEAFSLGITGNLKKLNSQPAGGDATCFVSVDPTGKYVFVANYIGGNISVYPVKDDGSLGAVLATVKFKGSGPHARQDRPYAHAIYADKGFVYACDLGSDRVWSFVFDDKSGALTATNPDAGAVPPGSGPRHLALHPNGKFAYANNEMGLSVTAFSRDSETGALTAIETVPTSEKVKGPADGVTTAEIFCHPNGKWLYVSSRGDNIIAVYSIAQDGKLKLIQNAPAEVKIPRGMGIDPTGQWLVVAGQQSNDLAALKIDQEQGTLSFAGQKAGVPAPVCVVFLP